MGRFCYCSKLLPGKIAQVRAHWKKKEAKNNPKIIALEEEFWDHLMMTGFESWLQITPKGEYLIHCLEGGSIEQIFKGLREQIAAGHPIALQLRDFYMEVLGKDYAASTVEPRIVNVMDISIPTNSETMKRAFFFPLLPEKEAAHIRFKQEAMGAKKARHKESMKAFGVSHLSSWIQTNAQEKYLITYTERHINTPSTPEDRLKQAAHSSAWAEISAVLMDHTGLKASELSPNVEWLTEMVAH